jgi:hypothetical protein
MLHGLLNRLVDSDRLRRLPGLRLGSQAARCKNN